LALRIYEAFLSSSEKVPGKYNLFQDRVRPLCFHCII
jgi:hypothetical protein